MSGSASHRRCVVVGISAIVSCVAAAVSAQSIEFVENAAGDHEYALLETIPAGFGSGEFTLELWIRPDDTYPTGTFSEGAPDQLTEWYSGDPAPYSSGGWWFRGNFLLDGHNNSDFTEGTFSLQLYGGGRVRWTFGDGSNAGAGGVRAIQGAPSLLDGDWHRVTLVRRWSGASSADLELWIDGDLVDAQTSLVRTNMRDYWDS